MSDKKIINILAINGIFLAFIVFIFDIKCLFKSIFHIPCISCGLTRAFNSIIHLDFISAIKYNVLSISIFMLVVLFYVLYFINIFFKKDYIIKYYKLLCKYYYLLIIILIIGWIINIYLCKLNLNIFKICFFYDKIYIR